MKQKTTFACLVLAVFLFKRSDCGTVMATSIFSSHFGSCESLKLICSEVYVLLKWSLFSETLCSKKRWSTRLRLKAVLSFI